MSSFARKVQRNQMKAARLKVSRSDSTDKRRRKLSDFITVPKAMVPGSSRAERRALSADLRKKASGRNS